MQVGTPIARAYMGDARRIANAGGLYPHSMPPQAGAIELMSKSWNPGPSLQTRVLVLAVVISASVLVVTQWLTTFSSIRTIENDARIQGADEAEHLADQLESWPSVDFPADLRVVVRELLELQPDVTRVDVYANIDGTLKLIETSSANGSRNVTSQEKEALVERTPDTFVIDDASTRQLFAVHPFLFSDGREGLVTVVTSLHTADAILAARSRIGIYSLLANVVLLVAAITLVFRATVYRSVQHLVDVMHRFQKGDTQARAREALTGEFTELARTLNPMLEEIQKFNDRLQQGVETATRELATRNQELQELNLQLYETQKRLSQAERLAVVGHLTATFAHEIGSPLSAISTHLQMLLEDSTLEPQVKDRLRLAHEQIDRVCGIVESLLATTRRAPHRVPVDVADIVDKVVRLLRPGFESHHIRFDFVGTDGPYMVEGEPDQLQQLFLNLFNNALDAIRGPGALKVEIRRRLLGEDDTASSLQIDVSDTGVGIPAEKLRDIFDPLFTAKAFGKGSGLGLAVSQDIVKRHNGRISVVSQPGKGTCFTILLPELQTSEAVVAGARTAQEIESK